MKCGRFIHGETKVDRQVCEVWPEACKTQLLLADSHRQISGLERRLARVCLKPWDAYAESAGSRPLTLMTGERGEEGCVLTQLQSGLAQNWARLEFAGEIDCKT